MKTRFGARDSLITNESGSVHQADSGKSRIDSISLKGIKMANAKYLRKRIALVAAAALGVGILVAAPAFANTGTFVVPSIGTVTPANPVVSTQVVVPINVTLAGVATAGDIFTETASVFSVPTNSALTVASVTAATTGFDTGSFALTATTSRAVISAATNVITYTQPGSSPAANAGPIVGGQFAFTPDVPGKYVLSLVSAASATVTVTINVTGAQLVQAASGLGAVSGTQTTGLNSTAAFTTPVGNVAGSVYQITADGGATISSVFSGTTANAVNAVTYSPTITGVTKTNGTDFSGGANYTGQGTVTQAIFTGGTPVIEQFTVTVSDATAGTAHIYVKSVNPISGALTTLSTVTLTYVGSASTGINAANSTIGLQSASCPTAGASKSADANGLVANAVTTVNAAGGTAHVCVYTRDSNGNLIAVTTASLINTSLGTLPGGTGSVAASASSSQDKLLTGVSTMVGAATVTAVLIDAAGNAITLSTPVTFYGTLASLTLSNYKFAASYGGAAVSPALLVVAKDAGGNQIDLSAALNSANTFTVASDKVAGTPTARTTATLGGSVSSAYTSTDLANYGANLISVSCLNSTAAEKLTITVLGKNSTPADVVSNSVTFYCSDITSAVTVTPAATSVVAGGSTTVNISATDTNGYPVADATAVTMAVNNGAGLSTPSTTTRNGVLKYPAIVLAGSNGPITVQAVVGSKNVSGSASIAVTGGTTGTSGGLSAADSAAIAAAKASADAATAAVAALSTTIASLIASITAQIRALSAQIAKLTGRSGGSTPGLPKTGKKH
jgi:hypothetical protein